MAKRAGLRERAQDLGRCLVAALGVSLVIAAIQLTFPAPELASYDFRLKLESKLAPVPMRDDLLLVEIDDQALLTQGRWPWPRRTWKLVLETLTELKARAVFFDVVYPYLTPTLTETDLGAKSLSEAIQTAHHVARDTFKMVVGDLAHVQRSVQTSAVPELERLYDSSLGPAEETLLPFAVSDDQAMGAALKLARDDGLIISGVISGDIYAPESPGAQSSGYRQALRWILDNPGRPVKDSPGAAGLSPAALTALAEDVQLFPLMVKDPALLTSTAGLAPEAAAALLSRGRAVRQELLDTLVEKALGGRDPGPASRADLLKAALPPAWLRLIDADDSQLDQALARALFRDRYLRHLSAASTQTVTPLDALLFPVFDIGRRYDVMGGDWASMDRDGSLRSVTLLHTTDDGVVPTGGLAMLLELWTAEAGGKAPELAYEPDGALRITPAAKGARPVRIPTLPGGRALVHWTGPLHPAIAGVSLGPVLEYAKTLRQRRAALFAAGTQPTWALAEIARGLQLSAGDAPVSLAELVHRLPPSFSQVTADRWLQPKSADTPASVDEKRLPAAWWALLAKHAEHAEDAYMEKFTTALKKKLAEPGLAEEKAAGWRAKVAEYERLGPALAKLREELAKRIAGKVCFIGHTAKSTTDQAPMAFSTLYPKVGTYPSLLNTISGEHFLSRPWATGTGDPTGEPTPGVQVPLLFAMCLITALSSAHLTARRGVLVSAALLVAWFAIAVGAFIRAGVWLDLVAPLTGVVLTHAAIFTHSHSRSENVRKMFESYVDPRIVQVIIEDESLWNELGGREQVITAFFSDIAGFTTLSELLGAHELSEMLTDYLSPMTDIILANEGIRDKYIGDAIVAFFGAPIVAPGHELHACLSSIAQQEHLVVLKEQWKRDKKTWYQRVTAAGMDLQFRIGLNTGKAKVGNFGAHNSKNYTMIGDTVNLAARLEGANKEYGSGIMAAEPTVVACGDAIVTRELDRLVVKGKLEAARVFEVIGRKGAVAPFWAEMLEAYRQALAAYHARDFVKAKALFEQCQKIRPGDGPSEVYAERAQGFIDAPPPADWNGTYVMTHK